MSLNSRFSALFLGVMGLVLVGFSTVLYISARIYLDRRVSDRLAASLAVLAAAAEIHTSGVEWEPQERVLPLGQESGPERLRWMVFDGQGHRIDHSRNLIDAELTADWVPRSGARSCRPAWWIGWTGPGRWLSVVLAPVWANYPAPALPRLARSRRTPIRPRCSIPRWS